jgi:hypothetical protein
VERDGDAPEPMDDLAERPPLTLYSPGRALGYLAVIPTGAGIDPRLWARASAWLRAGRLPDGAPLAALSLIVPIRKLALDLAPWARANGVAAVLYPDNDGQWWNPSPAGA